MKSNNSVAASTLRRELDPSNMLVFWVSLHCSNTAAPPPEDVMVLYILGVVIVFDDAHRAKKRNKAETAVRSSR